MPTVFVSSTSRELAAYRTAVVAAIQKLDGCDCESKERWGARSEPSETVCHKMVATCDFFVGIIGLCFGSRISNDSRSYTQLEYETALACHKPCLMFLCTPAFPVPGNLREPQEFWERQQDFRRSIQSVYDTFESVEELVPKVVTAITNCVLQRSALEQRVRFVNPEAKLAALICNRSVQVESFRQFTLANAINRPGLPQLCYITGRYSDAHDSLADRLIGQVIRPLFPGPVFGPANVFWQEHTTNFQFVIRCLFREFDSTYENTGGDFSAARFLKMTESIKSGVIIIANHIHERNWRPETAKTLVEFYNFWNDIAALQANDFKQEASVSRPIFIFTYIIFRAGSDTSDQVNRNVISEALSVCSRLPRKRLSRQQRSCGTLVLDPLSDVQEDHLMDWFHQMRLSHIDLDTRIEECRKIFGQPPNGIPMARIEKHLKRLVSQ